MQVQRITEKDVLYEDNHLIAINKMAGVLVQGDQTGDTALSESLADFLKKKYKKPGNVFAGVIHRLDRPVSGLVLFAKTSKGLARMNDVFKNRQVKKTYLCLVEGRVNDISARIESYLKKDGKKNKSFSSQKESKDSKKAILEYEVLQHLDRYTLLKVNPETGRHHQIRAQLSSIGHVIKGDLKYGAKRSNDDASICLHAYELSFLHPIKKEEVTIRCKLKDNPSWPSVDV